ncbi:MAG TPA: ABC transporter ATP-binding protein [Candidatus Binataceae bacterium]|nr:ABC transporter ATP-binding protein [Candidatus Binataceae bacterium]
MPGEAAMHGRESVFECDDARFEFAHSGRAIVESISFNVARGEFLTIVGGSGTGKTTLLRMLGGLVRPTGGSVKFRGKPIDGPPDGAVVVFQDYSHALLQWRSVARNVALGLEGRLDGAELRGRVAEALRMVGLERNADDYPWQLSGGMQQRVQIARALALKPAVMLMDEPFGALDSMTKAALQDEMLRVHAQTGTSFVFITHDIEEAVYLGDRVIVIGGTPGRIFRTLAIDLPRPRDQIETRQTPAFLRYRHELHDAISRASAK